MRDKSEAGKSEEVSHFVEGYLFAHIWMILSGRILFVYALASPLAETAASFVPMISTP